MDVSQFNTTVDFTTYEGINMSEVFSPFYWGTVVSLILSGITLLQAYTYFPSTDKLVIQLLAGVMISLDIASTGLVSQSFYYYIVPHYGSLLPLNALVPTLAVECVLSVFITLISQAYFAWQIYNVMRPGKARTLVPGLVMLFAMISFIGGTGCSVVMITHKHNVLVNRSTIFAVFAGINKGASSVADILATIFLCLQLGSARTGIESTDSLLKSLMQYVIERGVLVTMIQTLILIIFFGTGTHVYWLGLHVNVTKLYANTFFAMLNGREKLRQHRRSFGFMSGSGSRGGESYYAGGTVSHTHSSGIKFPASDHESPDIEGINVEKSVVVSRV